MSAAMTTVEGPSTVPMSAARVWTVRCGWKERREVRTDSIEETEEGEV